MLNERTGITLLGGYDRNTSLEDHFCCIRFRRHRLSPQLRECGLHSDLAAANPAAVRVLGQGRLLIEALRLRFGYGPGRVDEVVAQHRALVRAIGRRDSERGRQARPRALRRRAQWAAGAFGRIAGAVARRGRAFSRFVVYLAFTCRTSRALPVP